MSKVYPAVEVLARDHHFSVAHICETLELSRSAYYHWLAHEPSPREEEDTQLATSIRTTFWKHKRRYGTRRLREELADQGTSCGRRRIAKLLKNQGLRAIQPKSFVPKTTDSRHTLGYSPNLLLEEPKLTTINQLWVGDITYVPLRSGAFCYLATLMDRFSRRIVGWHLENTMNEGLVLPVLHRAIRERQALPGLIHTPIAEGSMQAIAIAPSWHGQRFGKACHGLTTATTMLLWNLVSGRSRPNSK